VVTVKAHTPSQAQKTIPEINNPNDPTVFLIKYFMNTNKKNKDTISYSFCKIIKNLTSFHDQIIFTF
jgi:hypothetical protein